MWNVAPSLPFHLLYKVENALFLHVWGFLCCLKPLAKAASVEAKVAPKALTEAAPVEAEPASEPMSETAPEEAEAVLQPLTEAEAVTVEAEATPEPQAEAAPTGAKAVPVEAFCVFLFPRSPHSQ